MKSIEDNDLSFVVQGAIDRRFTGPALERIRKHFPTSQLILSTWEGANVRDLSFDTVVFSKDPGAVLQSDVPPVFDNVNRQLVSTRAGLELVTTNFAVKTRTDFWFRGRGFVKWLEFNDDRSERDCLFSARLVIPNYNVKNPDRIPLLFHPSDLVAAGRLADLKKMFSAPLRSTVETRYFEGKPRPMPDIYPNLLSRFTAEQYIWLGALGDRAPKEFQHLSDMSPEVHALSDRLLVNNFVVLSPRQFGLLFPKYPRRELSSWTSYTHLEWRGLCDRYLVTNCRGSRPDVELWSNWLYQKARQLLRRLRR